MKIFKHYCLLVLVIVLVFGSAFLLKTERDNVTDLNIQLEQTEKKYSGRIDELTSYQQTLVARLNEMQTTISTLQTANTELQTAYDEYKEENTQLVTQLNVDLQEVSDELARLQTSNDIDQQTIATLQEKITELQNSLDANCATISELQATIDAQEATIAELNQTIEDMIADLNSDLNNTDLFKSIIDGTVTEITAEDLAGVTSIRSYAFAGLEITSLYIPDNVTELGRNLFGGYEAYMDEETFSLETLSLPASMGGMVNESFFFQFGGCNNYSYDVYYRGTLKQWCEDATYELSLSFRLFINNELVTTLTEEMFEGISQIRYGAFRFVKGLEEVSIPNTVTLSGYAFCSCKDLVSAYINCEEIPGSCFTSCTSLNNVVLGNSVQTINQAFASTAIAAIRIPESVRTLNTSFWNMSNIRYIYIPTTVTSLTRLFATSTPVIYTGYYSFPSNFNLCYGNGSNTTSVYYGYTYEQYLSATGATA